MVDGAVEMRITGFSSFYFEELFMPVNEPRLGVVDGTVLTGCWFTPEGFALLWFLQLSQVVFADNFKRSAF